MRRPPRKRPGGRRFRWNPVKVEFLKGSKGGDDFVLVPEGTGYRPARLVYLTDDPVSGHEAYRIAKTEYAGPLP